jgi:hypothetical protein
MKILLATIIAASLSVGCSVLEGEQVSSDTGGGGTTSAPTGGGGTTTADSSSSVASWSGVKQLGSSSHDFARGIATDSSGNVYMVGYTYGDLDGNTNAGYYDLFVVKYDNSGVKQWTQQLGTSSNEHTYGITTDTGGNVYVTGDTYGGLDGNSRAGAQDLFVVKYDSSGIKQWTQQLGSSSADFAYGITSDGSDNIYVTGSTSGDLDGNTNAGSSDLFVVKYNSSGVKQWARQLGSSSSEFGQDITTDSSGNVYVTGTAYGSLDGNTSAGDRDFFVVKYDSGGVKQWTQQLGSTAKDFAYGITTDGSGNVYVTGTANGSLDGNTSTGGSGSFVVKYDSGGIKQWTQQFGGDSAQGITTDSSGNAYVTGYTTGNMDNNSNAGAQDLFVVKYNSSGVKQWTKQMGSSLADYAYAIATDSKGNVFVTGHTMGSFDGNSNAGFSDLFVVKYESDMEETNSGGGNNSGDITPPVAVSVTIDNGTSSTTNTTVNLGLSATDDFAVTHYFASESTVTPQAGDSGWNAYSTSVIYSFDNDTAETKTVNVWFKDAASNVSGSVADAIELIEESGGVAERLSGGTRHTCAIKADDSLLCWGWNHVGQSSVPSGLGSIKSIAVGEFHTCVIKADDSLQCWGSDSSGQSSVPSGLGSVKSVSTGRSYTCAIKADDSAACWGSDSSGAHTVPSGLGSVKSISGSQYHTCAIKADDSVQCWGSNSSGQSTVPSGLGSVKSVDAGFKHTCAIKADDSLLCWGNNWNGQSTVPSGLGSVKSVSVGYFHTCAIKADDSLQCWGADGMGQSTVPVGLGSVKSVAAGGDNTCAIKADDSVQCWADNYYGQSTVPAELQ